MLQVLSSPQKVLRKKILDQNRFESSEDEVLEQSERTKPRRKESEEKDEKTLKEEEQSPPQTFKAPPYVFAELELVYIGPEERAPGKEAVLDKLRRSLDVDFE